MEWKLRPGGPQDVESCVGLWVEAVIARDGSAPRGTAERAQGKFGLPMVSFPVAASSADDRILGFALVSEPGTGLPTDPPDAAYLGMIAVSPAIQGSGIGSALVSRVVTEALAGHPSLVLHVLTSNAGAVRFYERHGWRRYGAPFEHPLSGAETVAMLFEPPAGPSAAR